MPQWTDPLFIDSFQGLWPETTVDIVKNDLATGNVKRVVVHMGLVARRTQKEITEQTDPFSGLASKVVDMFYVSYHDGEVPEISEDQYVRLDGVDYKILSVVDQGAQAATLEIMAEMAR